MDKTVVIKDTKEKYGWKFTNMIDRSLKTGDYSLEGYESIFSIERKATAGELAGNIISKRFMNELKRGDRLKHFFVLCEFPLEKILTYPRGSGIPPSIWSKLKVTGHFFLKRIIEIQTAFKVKIIFCRDAEEAQQIAKAIFRRMIELYPDGDQ